MPQLSPAHRSQLLTLQIIWGACVASIAVLVFVAHTALSVPSDPAMLGDSSTSSSVFPLIAVALLCLSYGFTKLGSADKKHPATNMTSNKSPVARYLPRMMIHCALHEGVAILGFIVAMLSKSPELMYPYVAAGIIASIFVFPSASRVLR